MVAGSAAAAARSTPVAAVKGASRSRVRHSGLQKMVLTGYRDALRAARTDVHLGDRIPVVQYIRCEFRRNATTVDRLDIQRIEHLLRQMYKRVNAVLDHPDVTLRPAPAALADHARLPVFAHTRSAAAIAGSRNKVAAAAPPASGSPSLA